MAIVGWVWECVVVILKVGLGDVWTFPLTERLLVLCSRNTVYRNRCDLFESRDPVHLVIAVCPQHEAQ